MESLTPPTPSDGRSPHIAVAFARIAALLGLLFLFLVSIKLMETGIKGFSDANSASDLFAGISNPFAGLAAGILATVLVQSSSVTTATIVALVGSGSLSVEAAVPLIMGANIGTTITNTLVSFGSIARRNDFRRAFAAATVHDFFNLLAVAVFFPLQLMSGFLSKGAQAIADMLPVGDAGGKFHSPLKSSVKAVAGWVKDLLSSMGLEGNWMSTLLLVAGLALIFLSLTTITKLMRKVIADKAEKALNRALKRTGLIGIAIGAVITIAVQSSSITTSLLVPLCSSGVLTLENAFPVMLGANIGTTITAFLASLATDMNGLQIALVHVLFNLSATVVIYPIRAVRRIPIRMARSLAINAVRNKMIVIVYVVAMFILLPVATIALF